MTIFQTCEPRPIPELDRHAQAGIKFLPTTFHVITVRFGIMKAKLRSEMKAGEWKKSYG